MHEQIIVDEQMCVVIKLVKIGWNIGVYQCKHVRIGTLGLLWSRNKHPG